MTSGTSFKDGGKSFRLSKCSTDSVLFKAFIKGCERRMGRIIKQDSALSEEILLKVLTNLEHELSSSATSQQRRRDIIMLGGILVIGFCDALRGNEIFLVEASYLCTHVEQGRKHAQPHIVVPMMGRFKGETGERNILRVLVNRTASGIEVRKWVEWVIEVLKQERGQNTHRKVGPAFCDEKGEVLSYSLVNQWFHEELIKVQEAHPELIAEELDVTESYNIYRSLRRGATSRASALNYSETVINFNNRWRNTQTNKGKGGLKKMSQLYVEVSMVLDTLLKFSASL
jgi:hypothetical protein